MKDSCFSEKWDRIHSGSTEFPSPAKVLWENAHLLPNSGRALDLACGLGGNALFMANRGLQVEAWDKSRVAIAKLDFFARRLGLSVETQVTDVESRNWPEQAFDVVVVSRFLVRSLCARISAALKPEGVLFYQTFVRAKVSDSGPTNPDFLLAENELLRLFPDLVVRVYREEGTLGDKTLGFRDQAYLVGQKIREEKRS